MFRIIVNLTLSRVVSHSFERGKIPRTACTCPAQDLGLGYFVLKFAPVQSIFRTEFWPGLGLFF